MGLPCLGNGYTSRGYGCGIYNELIFVESKALKQAHSWLRNCFSNAAIGKNSATRNPQPWPREVNDSGQPQSATLRRDNRKYHTMI